MSNTIIQVENLGKKYLIKHQQQGNYTALRDVITDKVKSLGKKIISPWNRKQSSPRSTTEEFWALKDISFKVKQGEVIGIIGRNGAGKSTLLKILSRITEPTTGKLKIKGRVASLLEVGTGFHPELTGRENIFLNGAILGMSRKDIKNKFDEIVAFAEVEKFLDTPVKRYSSGMYVRLAFAVAAHLEPEILIVDEVLAVGDAQFQKKCLGKMEDISSEGRTVLFVSHNMGAISQLCDRAILLDQGAVKKIGEPLELIKIYTAPGTGRCLSLIEYNETLQAKKPKPIILLNSINITGTAGGHLLSTDEDLYIDLSFYAFEEIINPAFAISIENVKGVEVVKLSTMPISGYRIERLSGAGRLRLHLENLPLLGGEYILNIQIVKPRLECLVSYQNLFDFSIQESDVYNSGKLLNNSKGLIKVNHSWELH